MVFAKWFGGDKQKPVKASVQMLAGEGFVEKKKEPENQENKNINFDPKLIESLKKDHQNLFRVYREILDAKQKDDYSGMPRLLNELKTALQLHLMEENVRFYTYIRQQFKDDAVVAGFIKDVRKEMNAIANMVIGFSNAYSLVDFPVELKGKFGEELLVIGNALVKRVSMEESRLYTLYGEH